MLFLLLLLLFLLLSSSPPSEIKNRCIFCTLFFRETEFVVLWNHTFAVGSLQFYCLHTHVRNTLKNITEQIYIYSSSSFKLRAIRCFTCPVYIHVKKEKRAHTFTLNKKNINVLQYYVSVHTHCAEPLWIYLIAMQPIFGYKQNRSEKKTK